MDYNWNQYAIGGATRPDSFTGMTPEMQSALFSMLQAADAELGAGMQVYSGYRSPELQARLYQDALAKYGSEAEARKWVAPPGRSKHNEGLAADLKWNGTRIDQLPEDHPARLWLSSNVGRHGLEQRMSWEPWQVEYAGSAPDVTPVQAPVEAGMPEPLDFTTFAESPDFQGLAEIAAQAQVPVAQIAPQQRPSQLQLARRNVLAPYQQFFQSLEA